MWHAALARTVAGRAGTRNPIGKQPWQTRGALLVEPALANILAARLFGPSGEQGGLVPTRVGWLDADDLPVGEARAQIDELRAFATLPGICYAHACQRASFTRP